jgi:hypothetical protein
VRVLVGAETSGKVREAFRKMGHDAFSCDILPADDNSPFHYQTDLIGLLESGLEWDLLIAHPPCTFLSNSGVRWLYRKGTRERVEWRWAALEAGARFFSAVLHARITKVAIENPIQHKHAKRLIGVAPSQIIQPWQFGHKEMKATCLWLKGLPALRPTAIVGPPPRDAKARRAWAVVHRLPPSAEHWKLRSETYQGIADAMAAQWGQPQDPQDLFDLQLESSNP